MSAQPLRMRRDYGEVKTEEVEEKCEKPLCDSTRRVVAGELVAVARLLVPRKD